MDGERHQQAEDRPDRGDRLLRVLDVHDPSGLADTAQSAGGTTWDKTTELFSAVIDFLREF